MLKMTVEEIKRMDEDYENIYDDILWFEDHNTPVCRNCSSFNTAILRFGFIQRLMNISIATTKLKLAGSQAKLFKYYCNDCGSYFR